MLKAFKSDLDTVRAGIHSFPSAQNWLQIYCLGIYKAMLGCPEYHLRLSSWNKAKKGRQRL